jgi:hypothetical protein
MVRNFLLSNDKTAGVAMTVSAVSSREFYRHTSRAKQAANSDMAFITERGKRSHVLMSKKGYNRIARLGPSILESLAHPESAHKEFDPETMRGELIRPADFFEEH